MIARLSLFASLLGSLLVSLLGACWTAPPSSSPPAPPPAPAPRPIHDWARALAATHLEDTYASKETDVVSFTVVVPFEPDRGRGATIVPLDPTLPVVRGRLGEVRRRLDPVDETTPIYQTEVHSREPRYLAATAPPLVRPEYPFHAIVIVPPRAAKLVSPPAQLPPDLAPGDVRGALDLDADGKADVILWQQPIKEDYSHGGTYARTPGGWKSIRTWMPL